MSEVDKIAKRISEIPIPQDLLNARTKAKVAISALINVECASGNQKRIKKAEKLRTFLVYLNRNYA